MLEKYCKFRHDQSILLDFFSWSFLVSFWDMSCQKALKNDRVGQVWDGIRFIDGNSQSSPEMAEMHVTYIFYFIVERADFRFSSIRLHINDGSCTSVIFLLVVTPLLFPFHSSWQLRHWSPFIPPSSYVTASLPSLLAVTPLRFNNPFHPARAIERRIEKHQ